MLVKKLKVDIFHEKMAAVISSTLSLLVVGECECSTGKCTSQCSNSILYWHKPEKKTVRAAQQQ
jgi:hypothetical protein